MSFDVEVGILSKLLQERDLTAIKDLQLKSTYFTGENRTAFKYIVETARTTGEIPTPRVFMRKFPKLKLETIHTDNGDEVGTEENLKYWSVELRKKVKQNALADLIDDVAGELQDFKTDVAFDMIKKKIAYIDNEVSETEDVDITKNTDDRKKVYEERKKNKGMLGLSTGIKHLDYLTKGLAPKTLTTCIARTGVGKAVTLDTPILTPDGFVPMRNIKVGSQVIGEDGLPYCTTAIYPQGKLDVFRVTFEDGTFVDCSDSHLWKYKTCYDVAVKHDWRVDTLKDIMTKHSLKRGRTFNLCIPVAKAVQELKCEEKKSFIPPYVLGCLLGDGGFTTDRITFTNPEKDLLDSLNSALKDYGEFVYHKGTNCQYAFKSNNPRNNSLYREIDRLGLKSKRSESKFIPRSFLYRSREERVELLKGLIDTDGHVDEKGAISFSTSSKQMQKGVAFLCQSLGYRCYQSSYTREGKSTEYRVRLSTKDPLFKSLKHQKKYDCRAVPNRVNHYDILKVVKIEKLNNQEEMQCITVDSPDHTFICGDFIVTHNTWLEVLIGAHCMLQNCRVLQFVTEMSEELMRDRYDAVLYQMCYGNFNYAHFKSGILHQDIEKKYYKFLDEDLPTFEPLIIATATGVMSVEAAIEKYKPDLVLIDSAYLMEDDQGAKDDWLRVAHITRDLKKLAKRAKLPIFINTQADKSTSTKTGPELGSIMYTQAIGQDSDTVLAQFRDEIMLNDNEMGVKVLKQREGTLGKVMLNWDFSTMNFSEIYMESDHKNSDPNALADAVTKYRGGSTEANKNLLNIMD